MRYFLPIIIIVILLTIPATGAVNNSDLIINGGLEELTLQEGEKIRLRVQDDLTRIPILKNLAFQSTNPLVATVGKRNGILRAHFPGRTTIIVTAADGDNATVEVTVERNKDQKVSPLLFCLLLFLVTLLGLLFLR